MMEVALIPPCGYLEHTEQTHMQLMLPHLVHRADYMAEYKRHLRAPDQFVILDNGAAEDQQRSDQSFAYLAEFFEPNEIAIPDILGDMVNSVSRAQEFIDLNGTRLREKGIRLGYVAQGLDAEEAFYGVQKIVHGAYERYGDEMISTIFLPRLLVRASAQFERLRLAYYIHDTWGDSYDIHLFGASKYWPGEVNAAAVAGYIRSIDTSLPYQMSFAKKAMRRNLEGEPVDRPDNYFSRKRDEFPNIDIYVERFLLWAQHESIPTRTAKRVH